MNQRPKVTIVTPSFNQGAFIEETIKSVLNQTYRNIEYILVDAGSTDNTSEILGQYADRIDHLIVEKDRGQTDAINKGFKLSSGEIVGWLNSDDVLSPNAVADVVDCFLMHDDAAIVYGSEITVMDRNSLPIDVRSVDIKSQYDILHKNSSVLQPGSFYRRSLVVEVDFLNAELQYCMDLDLWLKLLTVGSIVKLSSGSIANFRYYEETKSFNGRLKYNKERRAVLRRYGASTFSSSILKSYYSDLKFLLGS